MTIEFKNNRHLSERIKLSRSLTGMSRPQACEKLEISKSTLQAWENGEREPSATQLLKIAEIFNVSVLWLLTGNDKDRLGNKGTDESEYVFIPRYNVNAAAGSGAWNEDESPVFAMAFRKYWIEKYLQADPKKLSVISVQGDSMEGVLNDKDVILINHDDIDPKEGIYVLRIDGHLFVKQVQRLPNAVLEVSSMSPVYKSFTVDLNALPTDFAIIGKVVWYGRTL